MNILAIDTATSLFSLALSSPGGIRLFEIDGALKHSEILMEAADYLFQETGMERGDLHLVACMEGPGSFTGLRIGFAAAKGLAAALAIPLAPVPTLDCMAYPFSIWPGLVLPLIDAKQGRFFTAVYRQGERLTEFLDAGPGEIGDAILKHQLPKPAVTALSPVLLTGPDAPLFLERLKPLPRDVSLVIDPAHRRGKSRELLEISGKQAIIKTTEEVFSEDSGPMYLRKSDAELNFRTEPFDGVRI
ncbi:MAG: tRNA (adenosine(37)-N6)-threonylcarbamoyltransferase complex dimerization subunit type 1 TsaB [Treponema sp.]|jgi:tRNA threonylcarbamoyladenosine biosynthesis protein TsaB|nr:tRNA (adenosine(37)-N6)-threonylcarbamoyltransferase complex dimerization subunit type 1 TsaB [Treponema sp.]